MQTFTEAKGAGTGTDIQTVFLPAFSFAAFEDCRCLLNFVLHPLFDEDFQILLFIKFI